MEIDFCKLFFFLDKMISDRPKDESIPMYDAFVKAYTNVITNTLSSIKKVLYDFAESKP